MDLEFDGEIDLGSGVGTDLGSGSAASHARSLPSNASEAMVGSSSDQSAMQIQPAGESRRSASEAALVSSTIFRAYDVRGLVGSEITPEVMRLLGLAVGTEALLHGDGNCIVARDQRPSGESLEVALVAGLRASGCNVIDLGMAPTPVLYFAAHDRGGCSAAMVTASHNPAQYNGLKVVLAGRSATREQLLSLQERIVRGDFSDGHGAYDQESVFDAYVEEIESDVALARPLKVVLDCGHAAAALIAPRLFHGAGLRGRRAGLRSRPGAR
jgi:phosphomannomutase/phosphoglucomutase